MRHNYLGMTFDFSILGQVYITMAGYEAELINDWFAIDIDSALLPDREKSAATPAINSIFDKGESLVLNVANAEVILSEKEDFLFPLFYSKSLIK